MGVSNANRIFQIGHVFIIFLILLLPFPFFAFLYIIFYVFICTASFFLSKVFYKAFGLTRLCNIIIIFLVFIERNMHNRLEYHDDIYIMEIILLKKLCKLSIILY